MNERYGTIRIKDATKDRLFRLKTSHKESYDDVINRILDKAGVSDDDTVQAES